MARIHILQPIAGLDFSWDADSYVEMPGEEAAKWADGIRAELVRGDTPETPEDTAASETTSARRPRTKPSAETA